MGVSGAAEIFSLFQKLPPKSDNGSLAVSPMFVRSTSTPERLLSASVTVQVSVVVAVPSAGIPGGL